MGYTHYWKTSDTVKIDKAKYKQALADIKTIVESNTDILVGAGGEAGTGPEVDLNLGIYFNGVDEQSHETFCLPADCEELRAFEFCKTAEKPYDAYVVACVSVLGNVAGIEVSSDGRGKALAEGAVFANKILGLKNVPIVTAEEFNAKIDKLDLLLADGPIEGKEQEHINNLRKIGADLINTSCHFASESELSRKERVIDRSTKRITQLSTR